jgi:hypothetical protein
MISLSGLSIMICRDDLYTGSSLQIKRRLEGEGCRVDEYNSPIDAGGDLRDIKTDIVIVFPDVLGRKVWLNWTNKTGAALYKSSSPTRIIYLWEGGSKERPISQAVNLSNFADAFDGSNKLLVFILGIVALKRGVR